MVHTEGCLHKDPEVANPQWSMGKQTNTLTFLGMCVCLRCTGTRGQSWVPFVNHEYLFYFLKQGLSQGHGTYQMNWSCWPVSPMNPPVFTSPVLGLQVCTMAF